MAYSADIPRYWVQYQMNNMYCTIRLNGVYLYTTTDGNAENVVNYVLCIEEIRMLKVYQKIIGLLLLIMSFEVASDHSPVHYQAKFSVNNMMCKVMINGMPIVNTMDLTKGIPRLISLIEPISTIIDEGENNLSIIASNGSAYIKDINSGYCDVTILAMVHNPESGEIETKEVTHIRYTYEKDESEFPEFEYILTTKTSKELHPDLTGQFIATEPRDNLYDGGGHAVQREFASRDFYVHHSQPFRWVNNSTPFEDTPANRQLLWQKYNELRTAILQRDRSKIRAMVEPGVTDVARSQNREVEDYFNIAFSQILWEYMNLNKSMWKPDIKEMDQFDLEIYAGGKLFRFNEKEYSSMSPLQWYNSYTNEHLRYNPVFTLINGKIVMAVF